MPKNKNHKSFWLGLISYLLLWLLLALCLQNHAIPTPFATLIKMWELKDLLLLHTAASTGRILLALTMALLLGIPLGIGLSLSPTLDRWLAPLLYFLYPLPKVAFLPIFMLLWGLGNLSKILLLLAIILLQVVISLRDGANQIPENYRRTMKNFQSTPWQTIRYLILPAVAPNIFASLRVSVGISLASLFFAENYATEYGLGYLILSAWTKMDYPEMFAGIFCIALLGFAFFQLIDRLAAKFAYQT